VLFIGISIGIIIIYKEGTVKHISSL